MTVRPCLWSIMTAIHSLDFRTRQPTDTQPHRLYRLDAWTAPRRALTSWGEADLHERSPGI
jgi:hypothetical protein